MIEEGTIIDFHDWLVKVAKGRESRAAECHEKGRNPYYFRATIEEAMARAILSKYEEMTGCKAM